jgi:hypothetical protein
LGTGFAVGFGVGFGVGDADGGGAAGGATSTIGTAVTEAVGVGEGDGDAVGVTDGDGDAAAVTLTGRSGLDWARAIITSEVITESTTAEVRIAWVRTPGPRRRRMRLGSDEGL